MKLTKYGRPQWLTATVGLVILLMLSGVLMRFSFAGGVAIAILSIIAWIGFAGFFRDPHRVISQDKTQITSPADGVIRDIELIPNGSCENEQLKELFAGHDILRVGIFLSVFNVHINRAPSDMTVKFKFYKEGAFHDARDARASKENESMLVGGTGRIDSVEFPVAVRQISGAIARRIVCPVEPGLVLKKGERYGMIKFGSRTELYLPAKSGFTIKASIGDAVTAGQSVLAVFSEKREA